MYVIITNLHWNKVLCTLILPRSHCGIYESQYHNDRCQTHCHSTYDLIQHAALYNIHKCHQIRNGKAIFHHYREKTSLHMMILEFYYSMCVSQCDIECCHYHC